MLQLLVPWYKDSHKYLYRLLDSIAIQKNINFSDIEVLIYNDDPDTAIDFGSFLTYPFNLHFYSVGHLGISGARNYLISAATSKYIMFCDQDDYFVTDQALNILLLSCGYDYDAIIGPFFMGTADTNILLDIDFNGAINGTLLHGRVFKLSYINEHNIRFNTEFDGVEDYYFVSLALYLSKNIGYYTIPVYIWAYNKDSASHESNWYLKKFAALTKSNAALIHEYKNRGMQHEVNLCLLSYWLYLYYTISETLPYSPTTFLKKAKLISVELYESLLKTLFAYCTEFKNDFIKLIVVYQRELLTNYTIFIKAKKINIADFPLSRLISWLCEFFLLTPEILDSGGRNFKHNLLMLRNKYVYHYSYSK